MGSVVCRTCKKERKAKPGQFGVVDTVNEMKRDCAEPRNKPPCILDYHVAIKERL